MWFRDLLTRLMGAPHGAAEQDKVHPRSRGWSLFHQRGFAYSVPRDFITYVNADDPMVAKLRRAYIDGLATALDEHQREIVQHFDQWVDRVARGHVEVTRATRGVNAEIVHLLWPVLDCLPTPYALWHGVLGLAGGLGARAYVRRYRATERSLLGRLYRQGLAEGPGCRHGRRRDAGRAGSRCLGGRTDGAD